MSEQTVSKSVHSIPQEIIEEIENLFSRQSRIEEHKHPIFQKVDKVEFIRTYQSRGGTWNEFKVNGIVLVSVLDAECWTWKTVECDEAQKKAFGKRVKCVMEAANVSWELAKLAVKKNPAYPWHPEEIANSDALHFLNAVKEGLDSYRISWKEIVSIEEYLTEVIKYDLGHLSKKEVRIIKEYWLSQCKALKV